MSDHWDMPTNYSYIDSPTGPMMATERDGEITGLHFDICSPDPEPEWVEDDAPFVELRQQLDEYFRGRRTEFDLRLAPEGTEFQRSVWAALTRIPYGATVSYKDIAIAIGKPTAVRAVGGANGRNPIPIVIPCHRVVAADGGLGGFSPGLDYKVKLLALEGAPIPVG